MNPALETKPLITLHKGKVKDLSALAKQAGIELHMPLEAARSRCHDLVVIETNPQTLEPAWNEVLNQLYAYTDRIESPKQGIVFLELSQNEAITIARAFKTRVATGSSQEEAHLLALDGGQRGGEVEGIEELPLDILEPLGIQSKTIERLQWLGLSTLGDLQKWSKTQLSLYLGDEAKIVIRYLKGPYRKDVAVYKPPLVLTESFHFEESVLEPYQYEPVLHLLAGRLQEKLETKAASRLTLTAISQGLAFTSGRISKQVLSKQDTIFRLALTALEDCGIQGFYIDELRLELSGIFQPAFQSSLWQHRESIDKAISTVGQRFPGALIKFEEVNPYMPIPEFGFKAIPLGLGGERESTLHYRSQLQGRAAPAGQRPAGLKAA